MKKFKSKKSMQKAKKVAKKATQPAKKGLGMPYGDRVLVRPTPVEQVTSFGIIIPDATKEKPEQGVVVAVGPGKKNEEGRVVPVGVAVGDKIMFSKYGYDEIKLGSTEYYLIREESITYIF